MVALFFNQPFSDIFDTLYFEHVRSSTTDKIIFLRKGYVGFVSAFSHNAKIYS